MNLINLFLTGRGEIHFVRQAWIVWSVAYVKRDKIRFANFTRYRGSRQGLVQARTLTTARVNIRIAGLKR